MKYEIEKIENGYLITNTSITGTGEYGKKYQTDGFDSAIEKLAIFFSEKDQNEIKNFICNNCKGVFPLGDHVTLTDDFMEGVCDECAK